MSNQIIPRRSFLGALGLAGALCASPVWADEATLKEPVFRVGALPVNGGKATHALDPALKIAHDGLDYMRKNVKDYTCLIVKRERIGTTLNDYEYMQAKIRCNRTENGRTIPLSVYMKFVKPDAVKGQECMWIQGQNNNKILAHAGGRLGFAPSVWLQPDGPIAMKGNRYPITEIGIENLIVKLIEKGERDRKLGDCEVSFQDSKINGRACTFLEVKHPLPKPQFDFHIAQIYIDKELNVPVRYAAFTWPEAGTEEPVLLEEYTYLNLKLNVGLTDDDFNQKNKAYNF